MPKKIKKKDLKKLGKISEDEKIKKTEKGIFTLVILGLLITIMAGIFIFIRDRGYKYSNNKVLNFSYSEGMYDEGYDVYELDVKEDGIFSLHNLGVESVNIDKKWTRTKYLNFNEELYESGILELKTEDSIQSIENKWSYKIEIYFENGEIFTAYGIEHPENTEKFKNLIKKYFDGDIKL